MVKKVFATIFSSITVFLFNLNTAMAEIQPTCQLNGKQIPCDQLIDSGILAFGFWGVLVIFILGLAISILIFAFWIWMIVHSIKNDIKNKPLWIIILLLFGLLGAIIYYFAIKRPFDKK